MRIAIVGTRPPKHNATMEQHDAYRAIESLVVREIKSLPRDAIVVSGKARGVDQFAALVAIRCGLRVEEIPPDYDRYPPREAPLKRDIEIADLCDEMRAFPGQDSRGTWHACGAAYRLGKIVTVVTVDGRRVFDESTPIGVNLRGVK